MCMLRLCQPVESDAPLGIDDIAFGVLTSERYLETRLASQQRTWLRNVRNVVFYSESVSSRRALQQTLPF